jgi:prophage regulatory protein
MKSRTPAQLTLAPFDAPLPTGVAQPGKKKPRGLPEKVLGSRDQLIRRLEVQRDTGLSRTALYRLIAGKDFPSQIHLSANSVAWLRSEVDAWIADRVTASRKPAAKSSVKGRS